MSARDPVSARVVALFVFAAGIVVPSLSAPAATPEQPSLWARMTKPFMRPMTTTVSRSGGIPWQNGKPLYTSASTDRSLPRKVVDAVTLKPLRDKVAQSGQPKYSVSRSEKQQRAKDSTSKGIGALFKKSEPPKPRTMGEWLAQERPKF
ncbi:MAG TPA: hypothetical protein VG713_05175 [Pirellulales bacterium]|nr:hypothetical protein [Pirellulales bacterium]